MVGALLTLFGDCGNISMEFLAMVLSDRREVRPGE
jgi:hypothetical protein